MAAQTGRFRSFLDGLVEPQPVDETLRTSLSRIPAIPDSTAAGTAQPAAKIPWRRQIDNYIALTKPGILTLLLATELAAMMVAAEGLPSFRIVIAAMLGGLFSAGGANALNCYIDRDIDKKMARTQHRATASGEISPRNALIYGLTLTVLAVLILGVGANWFAAGLAALGSFYYVVVYSYYLKRRSEQNIVIGGTAGAIPPLVGWAAVTGSLAIAPVLMFAIIYYWTPPHFWALALLKQGEYDRAGVPMLPLVAGEEETRKQVLLYTVLLASVALLITPFGLGEIYLVAAVVLNAIFLGLAVALYRKGSKKLARQTFFYSIWYLALLFAAMVLDRMVLGG
ncbi:MAG TPA: heme o synthase [Thermomicrobiales bacterium]|nr:heme o synthase [Thermomicrobiales bacterium]